MSVFSNRKSDARAEAGAYTRALLDLLGERDPLEVLAATPGQVAAAVAGLSEEAARRPEAPGKWSILQVVRHLVDSDLVWAYRLRRIVAEDRPAIHGYDQDLWAERLGYQRERLAECLGELAALRALNLRFLRSLDPADRTRVGVHSERGEESVDHLVRLYAGHDLLHLRQIARVRAALDRS